MFKYVRVGEHTSDDDAHCKNARVHLPRVPLQRDGHIDRTAALPRITSRRRTFPHEGKLCSTKLDFFVWMVGLKRLQRVADAPFAAQDDVVLFISWVA